MSDLSDLLLIAGAVGVGYLLSRKAKAAPTLAVAPMQAVTRLPDEGSELFVGISPVVEYVTPWGVSPWGAAYAPNFNFYGGGGRRHHGGGGHHHGGGHRRGRR